MTFEHVEFVVLISTASVKVFVELLLFPALLLVQENS